MAIQIFSALNVLRGYRLLMNQSQISAKKNCENICRSKSKTILVLQLQFIRNVVVKPEDISQEIYLKTKHKSFLKTELALQKTKKQSVANCFLNIQVPNQAKKIKHHKRTWNIKCKHFFNFIHLLNSFSNHTFNCKIT